MLTSVKVNGEPMVAVILENVLHPDDAVSYRDALFVLLKACFLSERAKDCVDAESFHSVLMLVEHFVRNPRYDGKIETTVSNGRNGKTTCLTLWAQKGGKK